MISTWLKPPTNPAAASTYNPKISNENKIDAPIVIIDSFSQSFSVIYKEKIYGFPFEISNYFSDWRNDSEIFTFSSGESLHWFDLNAGRFVSEPLNLNLAQIRIIGSFENELLVYQPLTLTILIVDTSRKTIQNEFSFAEPILDAKLYLILEDKFILVCLSPRGVVSLFEWRSRTLLLSCPLNLHSHNSRLGMRMDTSNGKINFLSHDDNHVFKWNVDFARKSCSLESEFRLGKSVLRADFLGDGCLTILHSDGSFSRVDGSNVTELSIDLKLRQEPHVHFLEESITMIADSDEGRYLVLISREDGKIVQKALLPSVFQTNDTRSIESISALECMDDQLLLCGYDSGKIVVYPIDALYSKDCKPLRTLQSSRSGISMFFVPSLGVVEDDISNPICWFLNGCVDGSIWLWDSENSAPIRVFRGLNSPVVRIVQPSVKLYNQALNATETSIFSAGFVHASLLNPMNSSTSSLECNSTLHRTILSLYRSFFAMSLNGTISVIDWEQGKVTWIFSGFPTDDSIQTIETVVPVDRDPIGWSVETGKSLSDLGVREGDGHVILRFIGKHSIVAWLLDRAGALCLGLTKYDGELPPIPRSTRLINFDHDSIQNDHQAIVVRAIPTTTMLSRSFIAHLNLKSLLVCLENGICLEKMQSLEKLLKSVVGYLHCWNLDNDADDAMRRIGASPCSADPLFHSDIVIDSVPNVFHNSKYLSEHYPMTQNNALSRSGEETAVRTLGVLVLLKKLESFGDYHNDVILLTLFYTSHLIETHQRNGLRPCLPDIPYLSRYYNDLFLEIYSASRIMISCTVQLMTKEAAQKLFSEWYACFPTVQKQDKQAMAKICVILTALLYEEYKASVIDRNHAKSSTDSPSVKGFRVATSIEEHLILSVVSLLLSPPSAEDRKIKEKDGDKLLPEKMARIAAQKKKALLYRIIGAELIGRMWNYWQHYFMTLSSAHLQYSQAVSPISSAQSIPMTLHAFVLRKLWMIAGHSLKESQEPSSQTLMNITKLDSINNAKSIHAPKLHVGNPAIDLNLLDDVKLSDHSPAKAKPEEVNSSKVMHGARRASYSRTIRPLERPNLLELYGEERIPSNRTLILAARNSLLQIISANPPSYVAVICNEIMNSGLRDGDWERVKMILKSGLGWIVKKRPILFFPDYLPQILETIIKGCLDPNIPFNIREKLTPHVTAVLHDFIKTYPTISFHAPTQKLCIGTAVSHSAPFVSDLVPTPPGFVIIWDLRTATKVQVSEAHSPHNITALSFNRGTNRPGLLGNSSSDLLLASYSIDDDSVKFWNQSSGLLGALGSTITTSFSATISGNSAASQSRGSNRSVDGDGGFLAHLASGGQLKVFRSFTIDHVSGQAIAVEESASSPSSTRRGSISANRILQHVKFEWETDRSVILSRADSSLKFKV